MDNDIDRVSKLNAVQGNDVMKAFVRNLNFNFIDANRKDKKRTHDEIETDSAEPSRYSKDSLEQQKKQEAIAAKKQRVEEHLEDLQACYFESCRKCDTDDKKDIFARINVLRFFDC